MALPAQILIRIVIVWLNHVKKIASLFGRLVFILVGINLLIWLVSYDQTALGNGNKRLVQVLVEEALARLLLLLVFVGGLVFEDQVYVVAHDLELGLSGVVVALLSRPVKGVPHDRDQHVEERDLDEEAREEEEREYKRLADLRIAIGVDFELAKAQLVLVLEGVEDPEVGKVWHDLVLVVQVEIYDVEGRTKHQVAENQDDQEMPDSIDRLLNQSDKESCIVK